MRLFLTYLPFIGCAGVMALCVRMMRGHGRDPFHHASAFVRFRPYGAQGTWDGVQPLA